MALVAQLVGVVFASSARAATGPGDDRQLATPTSWWTYTGVDAATVSRTLSANGARLTDLRIASTSPLRFTAVEVRNAGGYAVPGWWWYYGLTAAQVNTRLSANHARLVTVQGYPTSSGVRFAAVMVANSGASAKAMWWYNGTPSTIAAKLSANHARLISLSPYPAAGYYTAVMVNNTGSNAAPWWWYYGMTAAQISTRLSANHARLIDLSRNSNGTWNAVMYQSSTPFYWYINQNLSTAVARALQQGQRIIDVTPYVVSGTQYYAVVSVNNLNALSLKLRNIIAPKMDSGAYGFYLKQVGGPTLAALQNSKQYEPASALKVLYHAKSIHEESLGNASDGDSITYHYNPAAPSDVGICPDDYVTTSTSSLINADQQMMWNSDNRMTRGILEKYSTPAMLNYASTLGLTSTAINHNIGCPTAATHNKTTLVDLGRVYEDFQNGVITTSATWKAQFRSRMLNESNYGGFKTGICPVVNQEAAALGKSAATAAAFCNAITWIAKGGSYQYGSSMPYQVSWDGVSMTGLPVKSGSTIAPKYYVFGEYVDGTTINTQAERDAVNTARGKLYTEGMRAYIHAALATW